jgi:hypothetical protein
MGSSGAGTTAHMDVLALQKASREIGGEYGLNGPSLHVEQVRHIQHFILTEK